MESTMQTLHYSIRAGGCLEVVKSARQSQVYRLFHSWTDRYIVQAIATNQFDYVNLHYYYINQLNWPAIEAASRQDMGVLSLALLIKVGCTKPQKLMTFAPS